MATTENDSFDNFRVPFEDVKKYVLNNVPITPLGKGGVPLVYDLYTPNELAEIIKKVPDSELNDIYRDPVNKIGFNPLKLLQKQIPSEFWTDKKIKKQEWHGIASLAGPTLMPSQSDQNKVLLIVQFDADDPKPKTILNRIFEQRGYFSDKKTIVQDTPSRGLHGVIAIPVDPNNKVELELWKRRFLRPHHCKAECQVEIKTWFGGQVTLYPSRSRKDRTKTYDNINEFIGIYEEDPIIYNHIINELKNADCLRITPEEAYNKEQEDLEEDAKYGIGAAECTEKDRELNDPSDARVRKAIDIILGKEVDENGESNFNSVYVPHHRNEIILCLSSHLFHHRIRLEFAKEIIKRLIHEANHSDDNLHKTMETVEETYDKGYKNQKIRGKSGLIDAFKRADKKSENEVRAKGRLVALNEALGFGNGKNSKSGVNLKHLTRINEADLIADLARQKISFSFMNAVKQPCAVIKRDNVVELMVMSDKDGNFADILRQFWRDENEANGKKLKTTVPEDRITQARLSLIADVKRLKIEPIKTHLRVAWERRNEVMRYYLADAERRQIRIRGSDDGTGVDVINSTYVIDEIKEFEDSNYSKERIPIFFQHFNQIAQVLPSNSFDPNILDVFFKELTNVLGEKASHSCKRSIKHWKTEGSLDDNVKLHTAKVELISMLIPEISHHLINVFGPPQALKTSFLKMLKALIDPSVLDVILPGKQKDIEKTLAQNYFICFDNFSEVNRYLSDLLCAAVTGGGVPVRELFTTQTMLTLYIKACVALSSVTRLFVYSDAVSRLHNFEFMPFEEEEGYITESKISKRFEELKPQILACMYATVSKAINIRSRIEGQYNLGRMADVLEWGEAISQALGYKPRLYLERFNELKKIQSKHSASFDPLVHYYRKIYYDTFIGPEEDFPAGTFSTTDKDVRESGYTILSQKDMYNELKKYADEEEYDTKKSNKLWPHNFKELAERTREISFIIEKNDGFSVETIPIARLEWKYIMGDNQAVEKYLVDLDEAEKRKDRQKTIPTDSRNVESSNKNNTENVVQSSVQSMNTEQGKKSFGALANFYNCNRSIDDQKCSQSINKKIRNNGVQSLKTEHPTELRINKTLNSQVSKNGDKISVRRSVDVQLIEQRRSEIKRLNAAGYSQRRIAHELGISLGLVNSDLKAVQCSVSVQSLKTEQIEHLTEHSTEQLTEHPKIEQSSVANQPFTELVPEFNNILAWDCEWKRDDLKKNIEAGVAGQIYAFCGIDNRGEKVKLHLTQFDHDCTAFMDTILTIMEKYDAFLGFSLYSRKRKNKPPFESDIDHIRKNCSHDMDLTNRFERLVNGKKILDVYRIFSSPNVKASLEAGEGVQYKEDSLKAVAKGYMNEEKFEILDGTSVEILDDPEKQIDYCLQDANLAFNLIKRDDYRILRIMHVISQIIHKDFFYTCFNALYPTTWWTDYLEPFGYQKLTGNAAEYQKDLCKKVEPNGYITKGVDFEGGKVLDAITGLYRNITTYDVSAMYPTMIDVYNLSGPQIQCSCCQNDPNAKVPYKLMLLLNSRSVERGLPLRKQYWICKKERGIFANAQHLLLRTKDDFKRRGLKLEEKAVKLFANSGYGIFGQVHFKFYDFRISELTAGFGRYTLLGLKDELERAGLNVIYGDTDSLFIQTPKDGINVDVSSIVKDRFNVKFGKDKSWKILLLLAKKEYFGILEDGIYVSKIIYGTRSDKPNYFREKTREITSKDFLEQSPNLEVLKQRVLERVEVAFNVMSDKILTKDVQFIKDQLAWTPNISQSFSEYKSGWQVHILKEKLVAANNDMDTVDLYNPPKSTQIFYKIIPDNEDRSNNVTIHPERHTLNLNQYKSDLWTCFENILEAYGYTREEVARLKIEIVNNQSEL